MEAWKKVFYRFPNYCCWETWLQTPQSLKDDDDDDDDDAVDDDDDDTGDDDDDDESLTSL